MDQPPVSVHSTSFCPLSSLNVPHRAPIPELRWRYYSSSLLTLSQPCFSYHALPKRPIQLTLYLSVLHCNNPFWHFLITKKYSVFYSFVHKTGPKVPIMVCKNKTKLFCFCLILILSGGQTYLVLLTFPVLDIYIWNKTIVNTLWRKRYLL